MKVLFVVKSKFMESLGCMYLKSVIQYGCNHECKIVDIREARDFIPVWNPDIIGFSIMTGDMEKFHALEYSIRKRKNCPTIIVGGQDPTFFPEGYDWADMIIKGEAEQAIADMMGTGQIYGDINSFPWPARDDFPNMKVRDFITSRGCPYKCTYCYNAKWSRLFPEQRGVRIRNVDDVIKEIKFANPEYVYFQDSCFGVNMEWMNDFANLYSNEIRLPYQCNFRPEQITEQRAKLLQMSDCAAVRMALESASSRLRSLIGRNSVGLKQVREASEILREYNIQFMLQNVLGLPTSTIEDDLFTLETNINFRPTYSWASIYQPYAGTLLGDMCQEEGWYKGDYSDISDSFFDTSYLEITPEHREQLEILQKVFELCVRTKYLPEPSELTYVNLPKLVHKVTRLSGDRKLYLGLL